MSHTDTPWTRLAARTARGLCARKGFAYQDLADRMSAMGIAESFRSVESKVQRGSFRFSYFLAALVAMDAECPPQWRRFIDSEEPWEVAATHIFLHELSTHGLDIDKLAARLEAFCIAADSRTLTSQIFAGEFAFTLVLQLALIAPIAELSRFVDQGDIARTAAEATSKRGVVSDARSGSKPSKRT